MSTSVDAQGDRRLAGREHDPDVRPDLGLHRPASARGPGDRRRRSGRRHDGPRSDDQRPAHQGRDQARRGRSGGPPEAQPARRARCPSPAPRARATRRSPSARIGPTPSPGCSRSIPSCRTAQVAKLVGSTKSTVQSVRDRSHWNMQNVRPRDPVTLGLCSLKDLNDSVDKARRKAAREDAAKKKAAARAAVEGEPMPTRRRKNWCRRRRTSKDRSIRPRPISPTPTRRRGTEKLTPTPISRSPLSVKIGTLCME